MKTKQEKHEITVMQKNIIILQNNIIKLNEHINSLETKINDKLNNHSNIHKYQTIAIIILGIVIVITAM